MFAALALHDFCSPRSVSAENAKHAADLPCYPESFSTISDAHRIACHPSPERRHQRLGSRATNPSVCRKPSPCVKEEINDASHVNTRARLRFREPTAAVAAIAVMPPAAGRSVRPRQPGVPWHRRWTAGTRSGKANWRRSSRRRDRRRQADDGKGFLLSPHQITSNRDHDLRRVPGRRQQCQTVGFCALPLTRQTRCESCYEVTLRQAHKNAHGTGAVRPFRRGPPDAEGRAGSGKHC